MKYDILVLTFLGLDFVFKMFEIYDNMEVNLFVWIVKKIENTFVRLTSSCRQTTKPAIIII